MNVIVAKSAGFCYGVSRAIGMALDAAKGGGSPVVTLGQLINNTAVIGELEAAGVRCADGPDEITCGAAVIRAHGVAPDTLQRLKASPATVIDATCPCVRRVHEKAAEAAARGWFVVVIGQPHHPEVMGTRGWAGDGAVVVDSPREAEALPSVARMCVVGQTTYSAERRDLILDVLRKKADTIDEFDFICPTTDDRQRETVQLSRQADVTIVVGDAKSANTQRLYAIAARYCAAAFLINDWTGLAPEMLAGAQTVAVTSGASTPMAAVDEVVKRIGHMARP